MSDMILGVLDGRAVLPLMVVLALLILRAISQFNNRPRLGLRRPGEPREPSRH